MFPLRISTASQVVPLGPFLDSADGNTEEPALTIANTDIKIWKAGATSLANKNSGGATHMSGGIYYATLDATDTNTVGPLKIYIHVAGALYAVAHCIVHPADVYDALYAGTDKLQADVVQWNGTNVATPDTAGYPVVTVKDGTGAGEIALTSGAIDSVTTVASVSGNVSGSVGSVVGNVGGNVVGTVASVVGSVGSVVGAVGSVAGNVDGNVVGSVGSVAGNVVGSVAGNVVGNVNGSVGSVAAGGITATSLAANSGLAPIRANTAQGGSTSAITLDASASATTDLYKGLMILLTGGTGVGQARLVTAYNGTTKTATVARSWTTIPDGTTTFALLPFGQVPGVTGDIIGNLDGSVATIGIGAISSTSLAASSGLAPIRANTAQAGAATSITLDASASSTTDFYKGLMILLTGGTGAGQARLVTAYNGTTKVATVALAWATNPSSGTTFALIPQSAIPQVSGNVTGNVSGNVSGNVTGSVGSVVGNVGGNVVGSVASVTGNVSGSVGSVAGNVNGSVVGSVASVTGNVVGSVGSVANAPSNWSSMVISGAGAVDSLVQGFLNSVVTEATAGRIAGNFDTFFENADAATTKVVDDVGGAGGVADWTTTERNQIRYRLGLDGTTDVPVASPDLSTFDPATDTVANVTTVASVSGNVSGSVGSVAGNVNGNVVGSVASVTGNVAGSVGSVVAEVSANITGINGLAAAAASLRNLLDGTGDILTLTQLRINASAAGGAIDVDNAAGPGIDVKGSTYGVNAEGTGPVGSIALRLVSAALAGKGIEVSGETGIDIDATSGYGITATGTLAGIHAFGNAASGSGILAVAGSGADGAGIRAYAGVLGSGFYAEGGGRSVRLNGPGYDDDIATVLSTFDPTSDAVANVTTVASVSGNVVGSVGSVVGAVGSVAGNVDGNVVGSVGSVAGNVAGSVGSVVGAVGSVAGNVDGNVSGSVGSVVAEVSANITGINGLAAAAASLRNLLDGTGDVLTLTQLRINAASANGAIDIDNSAGPGIDVRGTSTGIYIVGTAATSSGIYSVGGYYGARFIGTTLVGIEGNSTNGIGIQGFSSAGAGIRAKGVGYSLRLDDGVYDGDALSLIPSKIFDFTLLDSYAAQGVQPKAGEALLGAYQFLTEKGVVATTLTVRKPDGSTAMTFTLNASTNPSDITRDP